MVALEQLTFSGAMYPKVINEQQIQRFRYWRNGLEEGMCHQGELFYHLRSFQISDVIEVYNAALAVTAWGVVICISCSESRYSVWINSHCLIQREELLRITSNVMV